MSATRTGPDRLPDLNTPVPEWPVEWATERASEALKWLAYHYPECAASEALHRHDAAVDAAAMSGDREAFLEVRRGYCRAGRDEALRIRRGAA